MKVCFNICTKTILCRLKNIKCLSVIYMKLSQAPSYALGCSELGRTGV